MTRLARPELCVINTHPVANYDGDSSEANRFTRTAARPQACADPTGGQAKTRLAPWLPSAAGSRVG